MGDGEKLQEEEELFECVRSAAAAFYAACAEHARVMAEFGDMLNHPDGTAAVHAAVRHEHQALRKYNLAIKAFADFLAMWGHRKVTSQENAPPVTEGNP